MTDFKKTIFLEIDIDNSDAERRMAQLTQDIDKLKEANKSNTKETQAQRVEFEKNNVAIKSAQQEYNNLKTTLVNNTNAAKANKGSYTELYNQWKAAEAQLKNMAGAFKTNENGITELTQEYHDQSKAVDDLKKNLLLFNAGISQGNLNVGNYGNTLEGMRNQLQQMRLDLEKLEVGSVAFTEMKEKIDDTVVSIGQAEGAIDSAGNRIAKNKLKDGFNDAQGAAQALTGTIGLLSLAMGTDSKAGETLRKITIGVTIAQTALTLAKNKDDVIGTAILIKDKALAAGKYIYAAATGVATVATKAFGAALAATGIGLAITSIIYLTQTLWNAKNAQEALNDARNKFAENEKTEYEKRIIRFERTLKGYRDQIDLLKIKGATEAEIYQKERELQVRTLDVLQKIQSEVKLSGDAWNDISDRIQNATQTIKILDQTYTNQVVENSKKRSEQLVEEADVLTTKWVEPIKEFISTQEQLINTLKPLLVALYGEDVVNGVLDYTDALKDEEFILQGVQTATENLAAADAAAAAEAAARLKRQQDIMYATIDLSRQMGAALADVLTDSEDKIKDYNKQVLLITIKAIKSQIDLAISATIAREIGTKGFAGIVTGAILTGLIEAAFGVAINSLEGFATGGKITGGTPINRSNGDNVLITAKTGEVIMNENQQRKLQAVAGRDVFSKLGIPGFDTGGAIGTGINTTVNSSLSLSEMRSLNNMLRNQPAPVVVYKEFTDFKQRVEYAEQAGSLV